MSNNKRVYAVSDLYADETDIESDEDAESLLTNMEIPYKKKPEVAEMLSVTELIEKCERLEAANEVLKVEREKSYNRAQTLRMNLADLEVTNLSMLRDFKDLKNKLDENVSLHEITKLKFKITELERELHEKRNFAYLRRALCTTVMELGGLQRQVSEFEVRDARQLDKFFPEKIMEEQNCPVCQNRLKHGAIVRRCIHCRVLVCNDCSQRHLRFKNELLISDTALADPDDMRTSLALFTKTCVQCDVSTRNNWSPPFIFKTQ